MKAKSFSGTQILHSSFFLPAILFLHRKGIVKTAAGLFGLLNVLKGLTEADRFLTFMTMHKALRISVSLLLSAFILLSGSGLIIGKMVCLKSGHTLLAAKSMKDCCEAEGNAASFKDKCCAITNISFQSGNYVPEHPLALKANFSSAFSFSVPASFPLLPAQTGCTVSTFGPPPFSRITSAGLPLLGIFRI